MGELDGRVALVTGGCSGIGTAVALDLARHGADVAIVDILAGEAAKEILAAIEAQGARAVALTADVADRQRAPQAVAPIFREQRYGKIVTVSSINGLRGKFGQVNYAAAKAGVIGLTKALATELARSHVNVNVVAPGFILTPMTAAMPAEAREAAVAEIPLGRPGSPEDVAALVTFLCTERARHIRGEVIKVDGGQYI